MTKEIAKKPLMLSSRPNSPTTMKGEFLLSEESKDEHISEQNAQRLRMMLAGDDYGMNK